MLKKIPIKNTSFLTIFSFGRRVLAPGKFRATGHISISYQPRPSKQKFNSSQDLWLSIGTKNYFFGRLKAEIFENLSRVSELVQVQTEKCVGISVASSAKTVGISVGLKKVSYLRQMRGSERYCRVNRGTAGFLWLLGVLPATLKYVRNHWGVPIPAEGSTKVDI